MTAAEVIKTGPLSELVRTAPQAAVGRKQMASTRDRRSFPPIASDTEGGVRSEQTIRIDGRIGENETLNMEGEVGSEY
jgi:hypothetical protein